jgi:O-acetyl-ADP-ribose deacetylase (regulator of RNase III)
MKIIKMKSITYLKGDATNPKVEGNKIICHICNDSNKWGAGFVLALSSRWKKPEAEYRKWANGTILYRPFKLGQVQWVKVEKDIVVANMIGQHDIRFHNGIPPIRYGAVDECLKKVAEVALKHKASIIAPRIGSGLAGGDWKKIEALIIENLCKKDIDVYIYDLE